VLAFVPVFLTAGWVVLLLATPVLPGWAAAMVYGLGSFICHQIPERSFHIAGFQLPVCARCLGIYIGVAIGVALLWMRPISGQTVLLKAAREFRWIAAMAAAPTIVTIVLETAGAWNPSNSTRALAGVPLGVFVGVVVMNVLATLHYDECVPPRPTVPKPPQRSI
jgi:uncharacterized membrane protein